MIPTAEEQGEGGAYDVGEDVEGVEFAAIGEEGLQDLGADAETCCDGEEGDVDAASARGLEYPVECYLQGVC